VIHGFVQSFGPHSPWTIGPLLRAAYEEDSMTIAEGILAAIEALMGLYLKHVAGGFPTLVTLAAKCNAEMARIRNQEAADEKAARDLVPK